MPGLNRSSSAPVPAPAAPPEPCLDADYCGRLAQLYLDQCLLLRERGSGYVELRYEEMLEKPGAVAAKLARFLDIRDEERINRAASLVRPGA